MLLSIGMIFSANTANSQTAMATVVNGTKTLDTLTDVETSYLYVKAPSTKTLSIQVVCTKISGTPNGKITWEVSHDGTNWYQLSAADSAHVGNVAAAQVSMYTLTTCPYLFYRVVALGRGTAAYQISATIIARKD